MDKLAGNHQPPPDTLPAENRPYRIQGAIADLESRIYDLREAVEDLKSVCDTEKDFSWTQFKDKFETVYETFLGLKTEKSNREAYLRNDPKKKRTRARR